MRLPAAALFAALSLAACQDPAGVGLGLIDEEQLDPNVRLVPAEQLAVFDDSTVAVGFADPSNNQPLSQPRVLAGSVVDPVFGDVRAVAYVDFLANPAAEGRSAADVSEAWLELSRTYAYGDTTTALPLELRAIATDWEATTDLAPDAVLAVGDVLSTTTVVATDSLRRFDLPSAWVAGNAATLVGDEFGTAFDGFALQVPADYAPAPGVVFGFETYVAAGSGLRVVVGDDTLAFALSEVFSSLTTPPPAPGAVLPARSNSGAGLSFEADLSGIGTSALSRARLRLPIDPGLARDGAFVRPIAPLSFLFGVRGEGATRDRVLLGFVTYEDGDDEVTITDTNELTARFQAALLDPATAGFDRYEVVPNTGTASLDVLPVVLPISPSDLQPRFTLTLVGGAR